MQQINWDCSALALTKGLDIKVGDIVNVNFTDGKTSKSGRAKVVFVDEYHVEFEGIGDLQSLEQ